METRFGPYIFISYSSKNIAQAEAIRNLLEENQLDTWMAPYDIPAGAKYAYVIDEAIENCSCVLLLLTKEAQESDHVDREIERAISYKKAIVPACLDGCALNAGFQYYLSNHQIKSVTTLNTSNPELQDLVARLRQLNSLMADPLEPLMSFIKQWEAIPQVAAVNPERAKLLEEVYKNLISFLKGEGYGADCYSVTIEPFQLGTGDVAISFVCDELTIYDTKAFCEIIRHMDNFEIYPLIDNTLRFSGVIRKVIDVSVKRNEG